MADTSFYGLVSQLAQRFTQGKPKKTYGNSKAAIDESRLSAEVSVLEANRRQNKTNGCAFWCLIVGITLCCLLIVAVVVLAVFFVIAVTSPTTFAGTFLQDMSMKVHTSF
uniref:Uncharacterized protein n=1 Tax=Globodera rostochiensis TaxID=31243 RepID=A0A914HPT0_GLORO